MTEPQWVITVFYVSIALWTAIMCGLCVFAAVRCVRQLRAAWRGFQERAR